MEYEKEIINPETVEEVKKESKYYRYLEYRKEWNKKNKDKVNNYAKNAYKNKVQKDENYIIKLREEALKRYHMKKEKILLEGGTIKKQGRPRKIIIEIKEIKPQGRPRKYPILDKPIF